jgi:hypothetical protein
MVLLVEEGEEDVSWVAVPEEETVRLFSWRQVLGQRDSRCIANGREPLHRRGIDGMHHCHLEEQSTRVAIELCRR